MEFYPLLGTQWIISPSDKESTGHSQIKGLSAALELKCKENNDFINFLEFLLRIVFLGVELRG